MNKLLLGMLGVITMLLASGCATTTYRVTEIEVPATPVTPPTQTPLVVAVDAMPTEKEATRLATAVKGSAESRLLERGVKVASADQGVSATIKIEVARREKVRLDEWRVYEGTANVRVITATPDASLVGETTVQAVGERSLDEIKAEEGVRNGLTKQLNVWLDAMVTPTKIPTPVIMPPVGMPVARLTFTAVDLGVDSREFLDAQMKFREAVAAVEGIQSCTITPVKEGNNSVTFDVTYDATKFPGGLLNTLVVRLRERGTLEKFKLIFRSKGLDLVL